MLRMQTTLNVSEYASLYNLIVPKDNLLRRIKEAVDFTFIYEELKSKYSYNYGRQAVCPIRMFKYLLLKTVYELSDVDVVERSRFDMSFKYFLDMAPEDEVIDSSSLTKFRKLRLDDLNLLDMLIQKTVTLALEKDIIKSKSIIVDATHTCSKYNLKSPVQQLRDLSKSLRKTIYKVDETIKKEFPVKTTHESVVEEITYSEALIKVIESKPELLVLPKVSAKLNFFKEVVLDDIEQLNIMKDQDARVGHKSVDDAFFGYKNHLAMSEERIITAAVVTTGEKSDGKYLGELIQKTKETGFELDTVIGDGAYSEKENIELTTKEEIQLVSKLNKSITQGTRTKEDIFDFNKDAGMYVCKAGHLAYKKKYEGRNNTNRNPRMKYFFDVEKCKTCPFKDGCYKEGAKTKTYSTTIISNIHTKQAEFQETDYFKSKSKERYKIEAKNSELKNRHGLKISNSSGLLNMQMQSALAIFVVNMKRILKIEDEKMKG